MTAPALFESEDRPVSAESQLRAVQLVQAEKRADIPADEDGFLSLPFNAANSIFTAWASALGGPPPNSSAASANGALSEAEFVGMAAV